MTKELMEWEIREKEEAEKVVEVFSQFVNSMGRRPDFFVNAVQRQHRTLQQSMFGVMLACIEGWSKLSEDWYDLRNEYTVKTSKKIIDLLDGNIHAPFI